MSATAADLRSAIDFAERQFAAWRRNDRLTDAQLAQIFGHYAEWRERLEPDRDYEHELPTDDDLADLNPQAREQARRLAFVGREVRAHFQAGRLTEGVARTCLRELADTLAELRTAPPEPAPAPQATVAPRRSYLEMLLDERTLNSLMLCGGALLVLGLVIWLWTIGVFANPMVVASVVGGANVALLGAGIAAVLRTRYQTAGKAVTLLACLVLPLNLWLYDAQGLVTLAGGGHLWVPALAICATYAATARALKDSKFVYALVAGVSLTGMLFLADAQVGRFQEVLAPSALLVVIGVACVHAERLFAPGEGPFSRDKFGRAFFNAGHLAMAAGLAVLLGGRVTGWLYEPFLADLNLFAAPDVAVKESVKLLALGLAALATYTYVYSQMVVARGGRYAYSALLTLLWCEVIALDLLPLPMTAQLMALVLSSTALMGYGLAAAALRVTGRDGDEKRDGANPVSKLADGCSRVATGMTAVALMLGGWLFVSGAFTITTERSLGAFDFDAVYVAAMLTLAAAGWAGGWAHARLGRRGLEDFSHQLSGAAGVLALTGALPLLNTPHLAVGLPVVGLLPLGMVMAAVRSSDERARRALRHVSLVSGVSLVAIAAMVLVGFAPAATGWAGAYLPLLLAAFFAESAALFGVAAVKGTDRVGSVGAAATVSAASACAAAWQALVFFGFTAFAPLMAPSLAGVVGLAVGRWMASRAGDDPARLGAATSVTNVGAVAAVGGNLAGLLLAGNRLLGDGAAWPLVWLLFAQAAAAAVAGWFARSTELRRTLHVVAGLGVVAAMLTVNTLSGLSFAQRSELLLTAVGAALLAAGHSGWRRENGRRDGLVTFNLSAGSLLAAAPMVVSLFALRLSGATHAWGWELLHEVGVLVGGLALLGLGMLCRIRSTTVAGAATLTCYLGSLLLMVHLPEELQRTAVYLMVGGGAFFGAAVLLSVYRDRLLQLPQKVRSGEGVFQVVHWR